MIYPSIGFHVKFSLNSDGSMLILRRCFTGKGCNKGKYVVLSLGSNRFIQFHVGF